MPLPLFGKPPKFEGNVLAINKYFSIISQGDAPGKRLVPGGGLAIMGSYSQWEYPKVVG
jgi:hypothetical protein